MKIMIVQWSFVCKLSQTPGLTQNAKKIQFGKKETSFWGRIYGEGGVKPDPSKVEALECIFAQHYVRTVFVRLFARKHKSGILHVCSLYCYCHLRARYAMICNF